MLQGEGKAGPDSAGLAVDGQPLGAAALKPVQAAAVNLGVFAGRHDGVVQNRPFGGRGQLFQEAQVVLDVAGGLGDLDEAVPALAQHLAQIQNVGVGHGVGDHG